MPFKFYHPRYWFVWLGIGILWLITRLPWRWQMNIGSVIGRLLYALLPSRRRVSCINLQIAFPELTTNEIQLLNKKHFISLAQGLIDAAMSWWGNTERLAKMAHIEGLEHLENNKNEKILLVGAHFTSLEVGGRIISSHVPVDAVYRPHHNDLLEFLVAKERNKHFRKTISKRNIRQMFKSIKEGHVSWYATDQNYRLKNSILVPFFGTDAPSNPSTARIAKMTGAKIIPIFTFRLLGNSSKNKQDKRKGYLLRILPPVDDFPTGDDYQDTQKLNQIIEEQIREFPEQYLWSHERYKTYRSENTDFYKDYLKEHPDNTCQ